MCNLLEDGQFSSQLPLSSSRWPVLLDSWPQILIISTVLYVLYWSASFQNQITLPFLDYLGLYKPSVVYRRREWGSSLHVGDESCAGMFPFSVDIGMDTPQDSKEDEELLIHFDLWVVCQLIYYQLMNLLSINLLQDTLKDILLPEGYFLVCFAFDLSKLVEILLAEASSSFAFLSS